MKIKKYYVFAPIKERWKKLYADNPGLSPYQGDEYMSVALSHYFPYAVKLQVIPVFLEITENERTIMIVPLCKHLLKNEYTLFGDQSGCGYLDCIYSQDLGKDKMEECFRYVGQMLRGSTLYINRLKESSILCRYLLEKYEPKGTRTCACIELPDSYDAYLGSLKKDWRHHIRTNYSRLESEQSVATLKTYYKEPLPKKEFLQISDCYFERRKSRYDQKGALFYKFFLRYFDIGSAAMRERGNYIHFILCINDCVAAFCTGFISPEKGEILLFRLAINGDFAEFSPGILLLNESIKKIYELGIAKKIDMLEGNQRYKHEMGARQHNCYAFELQFSKK